MKVVVTGAAGFVGGHITRRLCRDGHEVFALAHKQVDKDTSKFGSIIWSHADISAPIDVVLPDDVDLVVHCAASTNLHIPFEKLFSINVDGTRNVYNWAKKNNVKRFIHISSASVYDFTQVQSAKESNVNLSVPSPIDYITSKRLAEKEVLSCVNQGGGPHTIILRPYAMYGPGDTTVLPQLLRTLFFNTLFFPVPRKTLMSATNVENVADVVNLLLNDEDTFTSQSAVYNIADEKPHSAFELMSILVRCANANTHVVRVPKWSGYLGAWIYECIGKLVHNVPKFNRGMVLEANYNAVIDISELRELGWVAKHDIDSGRVKITEWLNRFDGTDNFHKRIKSEVWPEL